MRDLFAVRSATLTRRSRGLSTVGEPAFEPLEPRQLMSAAGLSSDLLSQLNLSTTGSSASIALPSSEAGLASGSTGGAGNSARSLLRLDAFNSDPRFSQFTGRGFASVILDTGIDLDHSAFGPDLNRNGVADRIVYQYDFADNDADATDRNGHGSNVAGIIGAGASYAYPGVAPETNIIALKVFKDNGQGQFAFIERALQWVVANVAQYNIASVNMSLGDTSNYQSNQALYGISDELAALASRNVLVVSAAGNSFFEFGSTQGVAYPAADRNSIAVGATYAFNGGGFRYGGGARADVSTADGVAPFSQRSTNIRTVFAPGAPITSAGHTGGATTMQGTSQAAPQITGIATLAQQLAMNILGRRLGLDEFRTMLTTTGRTIIDGDDERDNVNNTGASFRAADILALGNAIFNLAVPAAPPANRAPTLTTVTPLSAPTAGRPLTITYDMLAGAANEADPDNDVISFKIASLGSGTLTKNGVAARAGDTLEAGQSLVWTPAANSNGATTAFSIVATDGRLDSATAVAVSVRLNGAPTLTTVAALTANAIGRPVTITYAQLAAAANEADPDGDTLSFRITQLLPGAALIKGNRMVTAGQTTLSRGESMLYIPPTNTAGLRAAFSVTATDGRNDSATPVLVSIRFPSWSNVGPRNLDVGSTISQPAAQPRSLGFLSFARPAQSSSLDLDEIGEHSAVVAAAQLMAA